MEPLPRAGSCQFCSMNFTTELWSTSVLSTKFDLDHGDTTRKGIRTPRPQRPCSGWLAVLTGTWLTLRTAGAGAGQGVERRLRRRGDRAEDVVVPAVGVVIGDDDGGGLPRRQRLQVVDRGGEEGLLVQWVGVTAVTVLEGRGLEERHLRQVAGVSGGPEVGGVVLVVGLVLCDRSSRPTWAAGASGWRSMRSTGTARGAGCSRSPWRRRRSGDSARRSAPSSAACLGRARSRCRSRPRTSPRSGWPSPARSPILAPPMVSVLAGVLPSPPSALGR